MNKNEKIKALQNIGFTQCENETEYKIDLDREKDRFQTTIFYDAEKDEFYCARLKTRGYAESTRLQIMENHNDLQTASKEHYIRLEKTIRELGFKELLKN